ncbi:erythroid membrane-associated protein-like [Hemicordylus capensis]|uniref:erythroid membrane-associated protein-like n=1 Tax=Hemicordylus capensis TaxID=884348 RepID=UPI0023027434|nr:erythroid membrane-associated protein-like [Hemicordylus capensis]
MGATYLVVADIFFPSVSALMVSFFMIAILSIALTIATIYKIKKDRQKVAHTDNDYKVIEEENAHLQNTLDKEKTESDNAFIEKQTNLEKDTAELDFRRASSNPVHVTLDLNCKHAKLDIKDECKIRLNPAHSRKKDLKETLIVVAKEGYSSGKRYWEVEVGDKPEWEIGVLTEAAKNKLTMEKLEKPLEEEFVGMRWYQNQYHCIGGNSLTDNQNEQCKVVGVFLDLQEEMLSFYNVQLMFPIRSIPIEFSKKMYPFFNPGYDEKYLGVCQVKYL